MFDLHSEELENGDFVALYYNPEAYIITDVKYGFIIFTISSEVADLRDVMRVVLIVMVLAAAWPAPNVKSVNRNKTPIILNFFIFSPPE